jgi:hypothetical protein
VIKPEQIPDKSVNAALLAYSGGNCTCNSCRKAVIRTIAAAINAWPDAEIYDSNYCGTFLKLPLTQESST